MNHTEAEKLIVSWHTRDAKSIAAIRRRFGIPEDWYYQNMERDYRKFGFDLSVLRAGLRHSRERMEGTRVRLIAMNDRQAPPKGTEGTVQFVDDAGTIHVQWDTGSSLGLIPGADEWKVIE